MLCFLGMFFPDSAGDLAQTHLGEVVPLGEVEQFLLEDMHIVIVTVVLPSSSAAGVITKQSTTIDGLDDPPMREDNEC